MAARYRFRYIKWKPIDQWYLTNIINTREYECITLAVKLGLCNPKTHFGRNQMILMNSLCGKQNCGRRTVRRLDGRTQINISCIIRYNILQWGHIYPTFVGCCLYLPVDVNLAEFSVENAFTLTLYAFIDTPWFNPKVTLLLHW